MWPGDAIWRHGTRPTLAQVMACCLTAPSHYQYQCWRISEVPWHSFQCIIIRRCEDTDQWSKFENCTFTIVSRSPRGQWVNIIIGLPVEVHELFAWADCIKIGWKFNFLHMQMLIELLLNFAHDTTAVLSWRGPLTRYGKLQVAHAPGMPGTFPPAANFKGNR